MQKAAASVMTGPANPMTGREAAFPVLIALGFCHLLNDLMQSLIPALYPMLKQQFHLDFGQIGLITLAFQLTASLLQPTVGTYTDRKPKPYSLAAGMAATLIGLVLLSIASSYALVLLAATETSLAKMKAASAPQRTGCVAIAMSDNLSHA